MIPCVLHINIGAYKGGVIIGHIIIVEEARNSIRKYFWHHDFEGSHLATLSYLIDEFLHEIKQKFSFENSGIQKSGGIKALDFIISLCRNFVLHRNIVLKSIAVVLMVFDDADCFFNRKTKKKSFDIKTYQYPQNFSSWY